MVKIFFSLLVAIFATFSNPANAQGFMHYCQRAGFIPVEVPCPPETAGWNGRNTQTNQASIFYVDQGQQGWGGWQTRPHHPHRQGLWGPPPVQQVMVPQFPQGDCRVADKPILDRLASGVGEGLIGALAGYFAGRAADLYRGQGDDRWQQIAVAGGAGYGFWQGVNSRQVLVCQEQPQQVVVSQPAPQGVVVVQTPQPQQRVFPSGPRIPCVDLGDEGKFQGILNLPGNPKHNQLVCAFPGDVNISQWR